MFILVLFFTQGTVTDGEFCSLRSQGETRPLHVWQIIHDAKESVSKCSKKTLLDKLEQIAGESFFKEPKTISFTKF